MGDSVRRWQKRRGIDKLLSQRKREGVTNKVTPKQEHIEWLRRYEDETTFDPLGMEEYLDGKKSFRDLVRDNTSWFWSWSTDAHLAITDNLPEDAHDYT